MTFHHSPYAGTKIALGTMHGKEKAIAKCFKKTLGVDIVVPDGLDTDKYGTFTGEIPRVGSMIEAARAKATDAIKRTGLTVGLASEGSYGPHPYVPFLAGGIELLLFIDRKRVIEITETFVVHDTNFGSHVCRPGEPFRDCLEGMRFPSHAVTVRPHEAKVSDGRSQSVFKGLNRIEAVHAAVEACARLSSDHAAEIVPDMRAHRNPTRMLAIRRATRRLLKRICACCPNCEKPGFGIVDVRRGLPCRWCGEPTRMVTAEVRGCSACGYRSEHQLGLPNGRAEPGQCDLCNP